MGFLTKRKTTRLCFGTKQYKEGSVICRNCPDYIQCGKTVNKELVDKK